MEVNRVNYTTPVTPPPPPEIAPVPPEVTSAPMPTVPLPEFDMYDTERTGARVRLERAVTELNQSLVAHARHMSIGTHEATGRTIITVYNTETTEVIREIPPERVLDAHASLLEMAGLFVDRRG